jgi:predicted DNA-binding transcriptional regulator AlpA
MRLIDRAEVLSRIPVTFPTIWGWMREGKFPLSRNIGGRVGWIESEVDEWIAGLPQQKYKKPDQRRAGAGR